MWWRTLCEPLSRLGADVVGIDASEKNVKIAKYTKNNLDIKHYCPHLRILSSNFDVILNMEIVEHVDNVNIFKRKFKIFKKMESCLLQH